MPNEILLAPIEEHEMRQLGGEFLFSLYDSGVRAFVHLYGEMQRAPSSSALNKLRALDERCKKIRAELERRLKIADGRMIYDAQKATG